MISEILDENKYVVVVIISHEIKWSKLKNFVRS